MASPLAPAHDSALNATTPSSSRRYEKYEVQVFRAESKSPSEDTQSSSSFVSCVNETDMSDQENASQAKPRSSRVLSGSELSPLKILSEPKKTSNDTPNDAMPPPPTRSPRKMSPEKRFPVKIWDPAEGPRRFHERNMSLEEAVQENDGLNKAMEIFEDEQSALVDDSVDDAAARNAHTTANEADEDAAAADDTMVSTFSTFSAVPNMTMFAHLGNSPAKSSAPSNGTPRARPGPSPSRTPRQPAHRESGNTTNLLMDFTEQLRFSQRSPLKRGQQASSHNTPVVGTSQHTQLTNLIDFDIPPMPTPRSVPSITPRELESLKSKFLSEISSLKASLSGKKAEVDSLKKAVGDAEKRVGESMEHLREERGAKELLTAEKEGWENRGRDMERVLRKVKDEIVHSQRETEELEQKLDESEKRREAAEMMHQEAESKMAGMRAGKDTEKGSPEKVRSPGAASTRDIEVAVERVARELHALYKSKHETKVAALKKSYESRWEKKIRELETRIEELGEENDKLRVGRDTTLTKVEPGSAEAEERKAQAVRDSAAMKELDADVHRLEAVVETVQRDNDDLRSMLERERVEKGELVQLAEEMMGMQSFVATQPQTQQLSHPQQDENVRPDLAKTPRSAAETLRSSIGRGSGIRAPGSALRAPHERNKSAGGGLPRPGGLARSGIMSSIERMGSYRGRGAE